MKRDASLEFSAAQAVTATAPSTGSVDQGAPGDALGGIGALYLAIRVGAAATAAGAATVNFQLQTDSDPAFGTAVTIFDSGAIAKTALTANTWAVRAIIPTGMKRYCRLNYVVGTGPLTGGTFDAFLTDLIDVRR